MEQEEANAQRRGHAAELDERLQQQKKPECSVCLEPVQGRGPKKRLTCGHESQDCCNKWLEVNNSCPVCKEVPDKEVDLARTLSEGLVAEACRRPRGFNKFGCSTPKPGKAAAQR